MKINISNVTIWAFNGTSFVLTGAGFAALFGSQVGAAFGPQAGWAIAIGAAFLLSWGIQAAIAAKWAQVAKDGMQASLITLVVAFCASALSWFGGAGGFALLFSGGDMLASKQQQEGAIIGASLTGFANEFADLRAEITTLSDRASDLATAETAGRVTCRNQSENERNCGPRCRLRQRHAAMLVDSHKAALGLQSASQAIAVELATTTDVNVQQAQYGEAIRLQGNAEQPRIAIALRKVAEELRGEVVDPETGKSFLCEDPEFATDLDRLAARVEKRVDLPDAAPKRQTISLADSAACVGRRVGEVLKLAQPCEPPISDAPLLAALTLEVVLVLLILENVGRMKRLGQIATPAEAFQKAAPERTAADLDRDRWLVQAFALFSWDAGLSGRRLAIPVNGRVEAFADGMRLVRYFEDVETDLVRFPIAEFDREWVSYRVSAFGNATEFNLFHWPTAADEELRRAERNLAAASQGV